MSHEYESDPQSGAGNCTCGASQNHRRHPHEFTRSRHGDLCVCALPPEADQHLASLVTSTDKKEG